MPTLHQTESQSVQSDYCDPEPFEIEAQGISLKFYPGGKGRLEALLELISEAQESLKIAFYIFACDQSGERVRDALVEAAQRGVKVAVIVDGFGAEANEEFFERLVAAGGTFCAFLAKWSRRTLIRNHQKIVIADDRLAMLGGFNVENSYFAPPEDNGWKDMAFTVKGSVVPRIVDWFRELSAWASDDKAQFRDIRRRVREWDGRDGPVQLLIGGPTRGLSSWAKCVRRDLGRSRKLAMMMAYFAPDRRMRRGIRHIARRGEADLILAGKSDNNATIGAARALYPRLVKAGARVYEFQPCKLHAKLVVLDDAVYLGSANLDMRSLYVNLEIVLRIEDRALAEKMRNFILDHVPASERITDAWLDKNAAWYKRLRWWASWFLVSVVDYTVSRKLNLGL